MLVMQGAISLQQHDVQPHPYYENPNDTEIAMHPLFSEAGSDNQITTVVDKKSPSVHQYQLCILQWHTNSIHRELPLLEDLLEATNVDVDCIQETKRCLM